MDDIFAAQRERERAILAAWHDGAFAPELEPYFRWKEGGRRAKGWRLKNGMSRCLPAKPWLMSRYFCLILS